MHIGIVNIMVERYCFLNQKNNFVIGLFIYLSTYHISLKKIMIIVILLNKN